MTARQLREWTIALGFFVALGAVIYIAAVLGIEQAQGALYATLALGAGYVFRGRTETPKE